MATHTAATQVELASALAKALAGDTIALAPGSYNNVAIVGRLYTSPVMITSADPAKPAVITDMIVKGCIGLIFADLVLAARAGTAMTEFTVDGCSNVTFDRTVLRGPAGKQFGMRVMKGRGFKFTGGEVRDFLTGIYLHYCEDVLVAENLFHELASDGVQAAGGARVVITANLFTNFRPVPGSHPDAAQVFTVGATVPTKNITITGNLVVRGKGGAIQGLFVTDQAGLGYEAVTIDGNLVIGSMWNAITLMGAKSGAVTNNIVGGFADMLAYIRVEGSQVTLTGNSATAWVTAAGSATPANNTKRPVVADGGKELLEYWFAWHKPPAGFRGDLAALSTLIGVAITPPPAPSPAPAPAPEPRVIQVKAGERIIIEGI